MATIEIKVSTFLPNTLDTREGATRLVNLINDELADDVKVELDFQGIIFMSRSFADQFHKDVNSYDNSIDLIIKNAEYGIIAMLDAVSKTQTTRKAINKTYRILSFNNLNKLKDYSYAW